DGGTRPMSEGDVLILVQRRSELFHEIIRACKAEGLAIAGADRLKLGAELAVRDLAALLAFIGTDQDDLSLAAALRSPLFGWTEGQLFDLATRREGAHLWEALRGRKSEFTDTHAMLTDLRDQADFLRPYDLIERILSRHDGRRRLLSRLGPEAEDGIDELLGQALAYERMEVPSLTGFLTWLETDDVEVKRQPDSAGDRIRVMTVHGAKGLEAPVVILPDTADRKPPRDTEVMELEAGALAWRTPSDASPPPIAAAREAHRLRQQEENMRLLYVALTRAQCWLILCAAGSVTKDNAWYHLVRQGMEQAGAELTRIPLDTPFGEGLRLQHGLWPEAGTPRPPQRADHVTLPDWASKPAPAIAAAAKPLSPSNLGGAKILPGEATGDALPEEEAKRRGRQLHLLLEHLPLWPQSRWPDLARDLLSEGEDAATGAVIIDVLVEATAVLTAPELAPLFADRDALNEVNITADLMGQRLFGTIDRLLIGPERVLAIDYKSNALIPETAEEVPLGLLRQMGAYAHALQQIFPQLRIETAILWTRKAKLMGLPQHIVAAALADPSKA
ncbi:double-strand break repair helicase AddA, partial [Thioclava sp. BHET1]